MSFERWDRAVGVSELDVDVVVDVEVKLEIEIEIEVSLDRWWAICDRISSSTS